MTPKPQTTTTTTTQPNADTDGPQFNGEADAGHVVVNIVGGRPLPSDRYKEAKNRDSEHSLFHGDYVYFFMIFFDSYRVIRDLKI